MIICQFPEIMDIGSVYYYILVPNMQRFFIECVCARVCVCVCVHVFECVRYTCWPLVAIS